MTSDNLEILPEEKEGLPEIPETPAAYGRYSMTPVRNPSYVTSRRSYGSVALKGNLGQLLFPIILIEFSKMKNMNQQIQWIVPNIRKIWSLFMMHSRMLGQIQ